jgi:hypothetical protein
MEKLFGLMKNLLKINLELDLVLILKHQLEKQKLLELMKKMKKKFGFNLIKILL